MVVELIILGFIVGASFGPINIIVLRKGINQEKKDMYIAASGAIIGDATLLLATTYIANISYNLLSENNTILSVLSSILLISIAVNSLIKESKKEMEYKKNRYGTFLMTYTLSIINPFGILLWLGVASYIVSNVGETYKTGIILTILGDFIWFSIFTTAIQIIKGRITKKWQHIVGIVSDILIIVFSIKAITPLIAGSQS